MEPVHHLTYFTPPGSKFESRLGSRIERLGRFVGSGFRRWHPPDFVNTPHNKSFFSDPDFARGYSSSVSKLGRDYRIPWRVHQAIWAARHGLSLSGNFVELGTANGFVMNAVLRAIDFDLYLDRTAFLFDIFEPFDKSRLGNRVHAGYYSQIIDLPSEVFSDFPNARLVRGDVRKTLKTVDHGTIAFLHVDLNDSMAEVEALNSLWNDLEPDAVIILDDFANRGEEKAFRAHSDFFRSHGKTIITTPSGQGIVIA